MIVAPLCSSSSANSTFIGDKSGGILIDVGCSYKKLLSYFSAIDTDISAVKAVLITHEHCDHVSGLKAFMNNNNTAPVYASTGTCGELTRKELIPNMGKLHDLNALKQLNILDFEIKAFDTPHDSAQSVGFVITMNNGYKLAYVTDLGEITKEVRAATLGCDFAFIESNYEPNLLISNTKYPITTKNRIRSKIGHLSNGDSASYIKELAQSGTTRFVLAHLSRENNTPQTAYSSVVNTLARSEIRVDYDYMLKIAAARTAGETIAV